MNAATLSTMLAMIKTLFGIVVEHTTLLQYLLLGTLFIMTAVTVAVYLIITYL